MIFFDNIEVIRNFVGGDSFKLGGAAQRDFNRCSEVRQGAVFGLEAAQSFIVVDFCAGSIQRLGFRVEAACHRVCDRAPAAVDELISVVVLESVVFIDCHNLKGFGAVALELRRVDEVCAERNRLNCAVAGDLKETDIKRIPRSGGFIAGRINHDNLELVGSLAIGQYVCVSRKLIAGEG